MCPITQFLDTSPNIEEVMQKIEDLREDIRILESYRNDRLLFVSRLPTEVLSLIFEYVATSKPRQKHSTRWMIVTQVCRLWRKVAIDTPRLWGTICVQNKVELAKLFLERSKTAPLHIKSNHETPNLDVATLCLSNPSRLRTIELHFLSLKSASWVPLFKSLKAPSLETLVLTCHHPVQLELGTEVDADHVPLLRDIELYNCFFNLQPLSVSHIRSLDIEYLLLGAVAPRPMLEVMLALRHMKQLESLRLINLLEFSGDIPQDLHIELPRLETLTLKSKNPHVMLMLRNFTCINIRSIVVNTLDAVESGFLAKEIASSFCSVLPNTLSSTWLKLGCNGSELVASIFLGSLPTTLAIADPTKLPPQASLQVFLPIDHTICLALLSVFQVPNLESLTPRTSIHTSIELGNEADPDHVPPLHAVHVNDYFFDLQTPVLSHVRFLTIWNSAKSDVRRPMLEVMLALRDMKQLETLELTDLLEFSEDVPEDLLIEVPSLEQIRLIASDPRVVSMLRSFICPAIRYVVADTTDVVESGDLAKHVASAFHSIFPAAPSSTWLKMKCNESKLVMTIFSGPASVMGSMAAPAKPPQASRLQLSMPNDYSMCLAVTSVFFDRAPKVLEFGLGPSDPDRESLNIFMRSLNNVEKLITPSAQDLLVVMSDVLDETQVNTARRDTVLPFSLPSLRNVEVTQYEGFSQGDPTLDNLRKVFERRRTINAGIEVLSISSYYPRSELEILKSEVQSLEYYRNR